ncbi:WecB/TagA/CpsF family glycosyltransferase [Tumebacillus permanentifrigoris]|uniref:N-acetylglucosaminyldiphosphoundecaprenol N-acetyl-beta-D-mannosaminyltransferase n=1 Tax=Tumebacillus permanentifrigoris TaxID=378543 RepID=A0A316DE19_9BACL|nr:WecB/TagA/CpsF family glycosyltransferase [Tumebacillus permanentifrigoris]PWK16215.1 N-acetylglucosaminyldiphosphoundecaprenol N-acetyl-beta-D-mannosaminyltransferase [Tumebacillus permanentifrigoris]
MVKILGVPFSTRTFTETCDFLQDKLQGETPHHIITANPEIVMMAQDDAAFMTLLERVDLITPDGIGAVWASKYYGQALHDRVTGVELSTSLIEACAERGLGVFLLGASPQSNTLAIKNLRQRYPQLRIAGQDGYFKEADVPEVLAAVRGFKPALLLVGLGVPRQELFIHQHKQDLQVPVMIGVGGCIDIFAGVVKRAPKLWQRMRMEWLYRLLSQPSRWRRQLVLPKFVLTVLTDKNRKK